MSEPKNPPLFARVHTHGGTVQEYSTDITLRDLFAAFTLAGLNANPVIDINSETSAKIAYEDADAMLAEREKAK